MRGVRVPPLVPRGIHAAVAGRAKLRPHWPRRGMNLSGDTRPRTGDIGRVGPSMWLSIYPNILMQWSKST